MDFKGDRFTFLSVHRSLFVYYVSEQEREREPERERKREREGERERDRERPTALAAHLQPVAFSFASSPTPLT